MAPPTIDLSALDDLFDGDHARMREWTDLYLQEAPILFKRLAHCHERGDVDGLTSAAHDLRPLAHYLGAPHVLELLTALGQRTRATDAQPCNDVVQQLLAFGTSAEAELRAMAGTRQDVPRRTGGNTG